MRKSISIRLVVLVLSTLTLAGCILVPVDDGYRGGDYHERGHGGHHRDRHDGNENRR